MINHLNKTFDFSALLFDSSRVVVENAYHFLKSNPSKLSEVISLCKAPYPISMRAARVVQLYFENNIIEIPFYIDFIIDELINTQISGVKRGFLKIVLITPNITQFDNAIKIYDICQKWLSSNTETIAVKAYSIDVLFKFVSELPDLKNELNLIIENIHFQNNNSLNLKCKKLLKKFNKP